MPFMHLMFLHSACRAREQRRQGIRRKRTNKICGRKGESEEMKANR
jgi:hypothetical protein